MFAYRALAGTHHGTLTIKYRPGISWFHLNAIIQAALRASDIKQHTTLSGLTPSNSSFDAHLFIY